MKAENRRGVDVVYHMNTGKAHYIIGDTSIAHLCLKNYHKFLFRTARHYDRFKPDYRRVSDESYYRMEC